MDKQQMLENYLKLVNTVIEEIQSKCETYDLDHLKLAYQSTLNMFEKLIESIKIFTENEETQKIQEMSQKLSDIISKLTSLYDTKEKERLSQLPKEESDNIMKDKLKKLEESFIELLGMGQPSLKLNNTSANGLVKVTFESYIEECDKIALILGDYKVDLDQMKISKQEKKNLEYNCERTVVWFQQNKEMFEKEIFDKILLKLVKTYKYILDSEIVGEDIVSEEIISEDNKKYVEEDKYLIMNKYLNINKKN